MKTLSVALPDQEPFLLELGSFNVFIGAHGVGKTEIMKKIGLREQTLRLYFGKFEVSTFLTWLGRQTETVKEELDLQAKEVSKTFSLQTLKPTLNPNEILWHVFRCLSLVQRPSSILIIENFAAGLHPYTARMLTTVMARLTKAHEKTICVTTHHPCVLDGINLHDPEHRLLVVARNDAGSIVVDPIRLKPDDGTPPRLKLSELWGRGMLERIPWPY